MGFELFTEYGRGHHPTGSIRSNGQIGLNQGAIRRFGLRDGYAQIYFDKERKLIGLKPVEQREGVGITRLIVKANNAFVSARSFLEFHAIPYRSETKSYEVSWLEEEGMLLLDLNQPIRKTRESTGD